MKYLFTAIIVVFTFSHCNNDGNKPKKEKRSFDAGDRNGADKSMIDLQDATSASAKICQRWDNKDDNEAALNSAGTLEIPFRGFYLFKYGKMVKDPRDKMIFGDWQYDDQKKILQLTLANGAIEKYKVQKLAYDSMLMSKEGEGREATTYVGDGFIHRELMNDPFYPPNMQWRVRPGAPEDDAALRKRIKDCLHFYYLYYTDNNKRNSAAISFVGLPACFRWYAGGIHLKKEEKLDKPWKDIFYNAADASKAYIVLDKMISKKYVWDTTGSWTQQNAGVLKQMEAKIDSL